MNAEAGHQVTVLDNLSKGHRWAVPDGAGFIQGDQIASELGWVPEKPELTTMIADARAWMRRHSPEQTRGPA